MGSEQRRGSSNWIGEPFRHALRRWSTAEFAETHPPTHILSAVGEHSLPRIDKERSRERVPSVMSLLPHCDSVNRLPQRKRCRTAKCGKCHKPLFTVNPSPQTTMEPSSGTHPGRRRFWADWCGPATPWRWPTPKWRPRSTPDALPEGGHRGRNLARSEISDRSVPTLIVYRKKRSSDSGGAWTPAR